VADLTGAAHSCPCGSGLRSARCCTLDLGTLSPPNATACLAPLVERARAALAAGDTATAEALCLNVVELAPGQTDALALLCRLRLADGRGGAAEVLARRIVAIDPNNLEATTSLALLLLDRRALEDAELHARNAVRIAPRDPRAHNLMGMTLTEANRPQVGEFHYRRVLELTGEPDPILLANLAWNLKTQGRMDEARTLYRQSVALRPNVPQTLLGWARLEEAARQFAPASEILDRADRVAPDHPGVLLARAVLFGRVGEYDKALAMLGRIAARHPDGLGPNELLEKARLLDRMGRHAEAWAACVEGKHKARAALGHGYLEAPAVDLANRLRGFFTAARLAALPRAAPPPASGAHPLFVLGFPRSGTTLIEQMLSAHPRISAGDELPLINDLTAILPRMLATPLAYPEALSELWMGDQRSGLDMLRDHYLRRAEQIGVIRENTAWFTDKMPLNEFHLGLIALVFPAAPLVHVLRHPLDVVTSVFFNHLTHGFFCALDLESIALHYVLTADLVSHYEAEIELRRLQVRYESLVAAPEPELSRILAFVGEAFDPRCLRFHENTRYARTASYAQVTEPLYERSRFRYRHYMDQLAPVLPILRPVMERLGYSA
jgi:tetratricopeptide (TPR) repeat protein